MRSLMVMLVSAASLTGCAPEVPPAERIDLRLSFTPSNLDHIGLSLLEADGSCLLPPGTTVTLNGERALETYAARWQPRTSFEGVDVTCIPYSANWWETPQPAEANIVVDADGLWTASVSFSGAWTACEFDSCTALLPDGSVNTR